MERNDVMREKIVPFFVKDQILEMVMLVEKSISSMVAKMNASRHVTSSRWKETQIPNFKESDVISKLKITWGCLFTSKKSKGGMMSTKEESFQIGAQKVMTSDAT